MVYPARINPAEKSKLLQDRRMKAKLLVMDIISAAFFIATAVYAGILASGILTQSMESENNMLWVILVAVSVGEIPIAFLVVSLLLKQAGSAEGLTAAFEKGQIALIVGLAFGETPAVFGVVSQFLGAPLEAAYGLIAFGVVFMAIGVLLIRPRVIDLVLVKMREEGQS